MTNAPAFYSCLFTSNAFLGWIYNDVRLVSSEVGIRKRISVIRAARHTIAVFKALCDLDKRTHRNAVTVHRIMRIITPIPRPIVFAPAISYLTNKIHNTD